MSQRYKGAVISATPPTVSATSPNAYGTAKGVWTLQQQLQYEGAGTWPNPFTPSYVEDVFSTYLYTGNGSTQTITNGINLSTHGGLVWYKARNQAYNHGLQDTARGTGVLLISNSTGGDVSVSNYITSFNSDGFTAGDGGNINTSNTNYASWTFRKAKKFFDVVTYTGNDTAGRAVSHALGSTPGCIIVKRTDTAGYGWRVYHRSLGGTQVVSLNGTAAAASDIGVWNNTGPTSTVFYLGNDASVNASGGTYVAYLFAHDAGGFGDNGDQSIIKCGSFTTNGSGQATVDLGWEPQWTMFKNISASQSWFMSDSMRGMPVGSADPYLLPNTNNAESTYEYISPTATGFNIVDQYASNTYIYIAIRRGPMKTPTSGTTVFNANATAGEVTANNKTTYRYNAGFPVDLIIQGYRAGGASLAQLMADRLRGYTVTTSSSTVYLSSSSTNIEGANSAFQLDNMQGVTNAANAGASSSLCGWMFKRAPSVFDIVCYTGDGSTGRQISHNLGVAPELIISRIRNEAASWNVYSQVTGFSKRLVLNTDAGFQNLSIISATSATTYTVGTSESGALNSNGFNFVAYLFATCAGVSKVSSYTGTGTTLQVNCGFTNGARFVMIKRTDDTAVGDWYVWDSARGITSGNDPYLLMNSSSAEVTGTDYINTYSAGFEITSSAPAAINANGGNYLYLAIA